MKQVQAMTQVYRFVYRGILLFLKPHSVPSAMGKEGGV
jgi:hypothetical protein